jgi:hypothetical protein
MTEVLGGGGRERPVKQQVARGASRGGTGGELCTGFTLV